MKILICDDQEQYGKCLKQHILKNRNMRQESWEIVLFSDSKKLYEEMEHCHRCCCRISTAWRLCDGRRDRR